MGNLSNLYVSRSFQSLIHLATDNTASANLIGLEDGYGNPIGVSVNTAGDLSISGSFTASLQNGYVWVGNGSGKTTTVATSSFGGGGSVNTGSLLVTASAAGANITFTKGDASQFTITVATGSFVSASYAETASLAMNAKDIVVDVKNTTGAQINKGTVVRIIGATGDNALIGTASWEDDNNSANTLGFVVTDIANDAFGRVMTQGTLLSVNTDPLLGYAAGQLVYLSSSGQFTNVKPPAPYHEVRLGQVLRAQQNNGSIYVLIQNGYELGELHDVDINTGSLANKDILAYDSASTQWENWSISALGLATTGSNTFLGNQIINGAVSISSSATYDLDITGAIRISGAGTPQLLITGSTAGLSTTITSTQLAIVSASVSSGVTSKVIASSDTTGTPTTSKYLGFSANPSQTGIPSLSTISDPSIIAASGSSAGAFYAPITFQRIGTWTDGRVTFNNPIVGLRNLELTGSAQISGSLILTGSASGNVVSASITSNTASIDFNQGNYFEVTSSVTPLHLNVINIKPGTTSTLIISASASSSITFSPNVAQPSGNAYSGSLGSIDILSLVAFNTSKVNVVSTKALV